MDEREVWCPGLGRLPLSPREVQADRRCALRRSGGAPLGRPATELEGAEAGGRHEGAQFTFEHDHAPHSLVGG